MTLPAKTPEWIRPPIPRTPLEEGRVRVSLDGKIVPLTEVAPGSYCVQHPRNAGKTAYPVHHDKTSSALLLQLERLCYSGPQNMWDPKEIYSGVVEIWEAPRYRGFEVRR